MKPAVANISLSTSTSTSLDEAVTRSINAGVVYTIASGNLSYGSTTYGRLTLFAAADASNPTWRELATV